MLSNEEAAELYRQITTTLSQSNLFWITSQVQAEVARGKVMRKSLKDISLRQIEMFGGGQDRKSTSKEMFSISEAYTSKEQLMLLLNALDEITSVDAIKNEIVSNLKFFNPEVTSIQFISDESDVPNNTLRDEEQTFIKLKEIILKIKAEI
jgi:hypothetical protein